MSHPRKLIVNIRGCNGSGKSTIIREFINRHTEKETLPNPVAFGKQKTYITRIGSEGVFALGSYEHQNTPGCDRYNAGKPLIFLTTGRLMRENARTIIFESFIRSKSFTSSYEMSKFARKNGYEYISLSLHCDFDITLQRLAGRNGVEEYSPSDRLFDNYIRVEDATNMLINKNKFKVIRIDTTNTPTEKMGDILMSLVYE